MIARPLELASRLRPEARNFDWLFFVNAGLIVMFFSLFGSRYVLAPGLPVTFRLPTAAGVEANAKAPSHVVDVVDAGQVLTNDGFRKLADLREWLMREAKGTKSPLLLVRGGADMPIAVLTEISSAASAAGFEVLLAASEPEPKARQGGR